MLFYRLEELQDELIKENFTNISFLIINSYKSGKIYGIESFKSAKSISVYQDNYKARVWELYKAEMDDIIIFDECNQLVFHLTWPDSMINTGKVKESIIKSFSENLCEKNCFNPR